MKRPRVVDGGGDDEYYLPETIIQKILSFLTTKEAVHMSLLSKSWYDAWCTYPVLNLTHDEGKVVLAKRTEARHDDGKLVLAQRTEEVQKPVITVGVVEDERQKFMNYADNCFRRYEQHNVCVQELNFSMGCVRLPDSATLVEKLLSKAEKAGAKVIRGTCFFYGPRLHAADAALPQLFTVLQAKALVEFSAYGCKLEQPIGKTKFIKCCLLRMLFLCRVHIDEVMLESIISSCPLIESLRLMHCCGMQIIKVANLPRLNNFYVATYNDQHVELVEAPSLETYSYLVDINVKMHQNYYNNMYFREPRLILMCGCKNLKKLSLFSAAIDDRFFHNLEQNFPNLEDFTTKLCYGFDMINISSNTLKWISLLNSNNSQTEGPKINAPSMLKFQYDGDKFPYFSSFAGTTTASSSSKSCVYDIGLRLSGYFPIKASWFLQLKELLEKVTMINSKVFLSITIKHGLPYVQRLGDFPTFPVIQVEDLDLHIHSESSSPPARYSTLVRNVFWSFRPKTITLDWSRNGEKEFIQFLSRRLMDTRSGGICNSYYDHEFWQRDLKEVKIEKIGEAAAAGNNGEGQPVSLDWRLLVDASPTLFHCGTRIRFTLKWKASNEVYF